MKCMISWRMEILSRPGLLARAIGRRKVTSMAVLSCARQHLHARGLVAGTLGACLIAGLAVAADLAAPRLPSGIPDFSSNNMGWASNGVEFLPLPGEKFVPVSNDPAHPHCGN